MFENYFSLHFLHGGTYKISGHLFRKKNQHTIQLMELEQPTTLQSVYIWVHVHVQNIRIFKRTKFYFRGTKHKINVLK